MEEEWKKEQKEEEVKKLEQTKKDFRTNPTKMILNYPIDNQLKMNRKGKYLKSFPLFFCNFLIENQLGTDFEVVRGEFQTDIGLLMTHGWFSSA